MVKHEVNSKLKCSFSNAKSKNMNKTNAVHTLTRIPIFLLISIHLCTIYTIISLLIYLSSSLNK